MNKLQQILATLSKEFSYKVKFAKEPSADELLKVVTRLQDRYDAFEVGPLTKTIFQTKPLDFYNMDCGEIWMFEFSCRRGVQSDILVAEIGNVLKWSDSLIVVRSTSEPVELQMDEMEDDIDFDEYIPLITDDDYSDEEENCRDLVGQSRADDVVSNHKSTNKYSQYMAAGYGHKE